jgi:hypothetical protein
MKRAETPFRKQKDAGRNGVPELFLPGIGKTNTLSRPNFESLCVPEPVFSENSTA